MYYDTKYSPTKNLKPLNLAKGRTFAPKIFYGNFSPGKKLLLVWKLLQVGMGIFPFLLSYQGHCTTELYFSGTRPFANGRVPFQYGNLRLN